MRQQYIKRVSKKLSVSPERKKEILRDLEEVFASAIEHGETERQVIDRLGTADEFAASMSERASTHGSKKRFIGSIVSFAISLISFLVYGIIKKMQPPQGAIGYADAMTNIQISGNISVDSQTIVLVIAICMFAVAIMNTLWAVVKRSK